MSCDGAKLTSEQENPIDRAFIAMSDVVAPYAKYIGATPNLVTTLSVIMGALASYTIWKGGNKTNFVFWSLLAYFFDCLDGHMARKYDMCSKFGDYYDHLSDWLYYGLLFYAAFVVRGFKQRYKQYAVVIYTILVLTGVGMIWHFGCQEMVFMSHGKGGKECFKAPTLEIFQCLCPKAKTQIMLSRMFGAGTFTFIVIVVIYLTIR